MYNLTNLMYLSKTISETSTATPSSQALDDLLLTLSEFKSEILGFAGDPSLVGSYSTEADKLIDLVRQLKNGLPATTSTDITDAQNQVQALKDDYNNFLASFDGKFFILSLSCFEIFLKTYYL